MTGSSSRAVLCNGADLPEDLALLDQSVLRLEYRANAKREQNVNVSLPDFVRGVYHLPPRVLDLLEIAAYVFSADRLTSRGARDALEYHSWARSFYFIVRVRDIDFWGKDAVRNKLEEALCFMTGDREYEFRFQPGHSTPPTSLFDSEQFIIDPKEETHVVLFSGGLDSLAGVVQLLETSGARLCLVSHRSQPGTTRTQRQLFEALKKLYPGRVNLYSFRCTLKKTRAIDENQRTRAFLFTSIAYSLSRALSQDAFYVFDNGYTSMNFPRRQDQMNARASRTTHPKTLSLVKEFLSEVHQSEVRIEAPFLGKTKTDVFAILRKYERHHLIPSTVSCNHTYKHLGSATHCGECFQCIDRRLAAYASQLEQVDEAGIYGFDFITSSARAETKTTLVDYIRQARDFAAWNIDHFYQRMLAELTHLDGYLPGMNEEETLTAVWRLCQRHGQQVGRAMMRMRTVHDGVFDDTPKGSFLEMINVREYLKEPIERLVADLCRLLCKAIPIAFQRTRPTNERDLNDKISALLSPRTDDLEREHPAIRFALTRTIPDHSLADNDLLIEAKYLRGSTTLSKVRDEIAADITNYPETSHTLFVVYDPDRMITNDDKFKRDFEQRGNCTICTVR